MTTADRRNALVLGHMALVEAIARRVIRSLPPSFELDDLIGAGNVALWRCATRYTPEKHGGTPFSAYARQAIRGAMLETVRRREWVENTRPGLDGIPEALAATHPDAADGVDARRMTARLAEAMEWLPRPQQDVLREFYGEDEPTLADVAARLEFSTQTARKLRALAIEGLQARFRIRPAA